MKALVHPLVKLHIKPRRKQSTTYLTVSQGKIDQWVSEQLKSNLQVKLYTVNARYNTV